MYRPLRYSLPEIWLPYNSVEVAINVKAENLADETKPQVPIINEEAIKETIQKIEMKEEITIFSLKPSQASINIIKKIIAESAIKNILPANITIYTDNNYISKLKKSFSDIKINISEIDKPTKIIGKIDGIDIKIPKTFQNKKSQIIVSDAGYDPLLGFSGGPSSIVRYFEGDMIAEAFRRRKNNYPTPGVSSAPSFFADEIAEFFNNNTSIEILHSGEEITGIFEGNLIDTHKEASKQLLKNSQISVKNDISALILSAGGSENDFTLADSLKAVWNVIGGINGKSTIALLAQCSGGLGSEALKMFVSDRLDIKNLLKKEKYVNGLEDLVYIQSTLNKATLILVSALPNYYSEMKMGFHASRKAGDALSYMLSSKGNRTKIHVLPYGANTLLSK